MKRDVTTETLKAVNQLGAQLAPMLTGYTAVVVMNVLMSYLVQAALSEGMDIHQLEAYCAFFWEQKTSGKSPGGAVVRKEGLKLQ